MAGIPPETSDTTVSFHLSIPKDSKMKVGIENLNVGDKKTVVIEGEITSISQDEYGKGFGMKVDSVSFSGGKGTIKEDFEKLEKERTAK